MTAYAEWDPASKAGKEDWVQEHLKLPLQRFHAVKREEKKNYAMSGDKPNILIDDYEKNIVEFNAAGGIGIHHVNAKVTIMKLKELGYN